MTWAGVRAYIMDISAQPYDSSCIPTRIERGRADPEGEGNRIYLPLRMAHLV